MLESNQDMVGCAHNFNVLDNATGSIRKEYEDGSHTQLLTPQVFFQCYFHTSTYIWRKVYPDKLPEYLNHPLYAGDTLHALAHGHKGNVGYIDKVMSVYRIHEKGMWNKMSPEEQLMRNVGILIYADQCFEGAYKEVISGRFHSLPLFRRLFDCSLDTNLKFKILQNISRSPFKRKLITKIDRLWQTHFS